MAKIKGEFTWCEFLTPCPRGKDCMVGDYDCSQCDFCQERYVHKGLDRMPYYTSVGEFEIECNYGKD